MESPKYFPPKDGKYKVEGGLKPLTLKSEPGKECLFQKDSFYPHYLKEKSQSRRESLEKYYPPHASLSAKEEFDIVLFALKELNKTYPETFLLTQNKDSFEFTNLEDQQSWTFSESGLLKQNLKEETLPYRDLLDALASQVQEDLAIWKMNSAQKKEWLAAVHLCFPSHWDPNDKIGKSFAQVHSPVASIKPVTDRSWFFVQAICTKGPFERFAWGLWTDDELNHHPKNPVKEKTSLQGRTFSKDLELFLRVERQVLVPFPQIEASLFTIRTYHYKVSELHKDEIQLLHQAVCGMSPAELKYKGLEHSKEAVLKHLSEL